MPIPRNWAATTSGELCEFITSGSRDWRSFYSDDGSLFIRTQDINTDRLDLSNVARVAVPEKAEGKRSLLQPRDLLVTITGANVGKVALVPEDIPEAYVSQSVGLMRLKDDRLAPFLYYYLQCAAGRKYLLDMVYGIGRPVLSLENLRNIPVFLPPLSEQERILERVEGLLSDFEAGKAALAAARAKLGLYRASILKSAVEGDLTADWRLQHSDTDPASELLKRILAERRHRWEEEQLIKFEEKDQAPPNNWREKYREPETPGGELSPLRPSWSWASIDQVTREVRNGYSLKPDATTGTPILRISAVRPLKLDIEDVRFLPGDPSQYSDSIIRERDLLFTRYNGTRTLVGVCALVRPVQHEIVHPDKLIRARPLSALQFPGFVALAANVGKSRAFLEKRIRTTAGQAGVSGSDIKRLPIPLPPLAEQAAIVELVEDHLSVIDHLESEIDAKLAAAQSLRQSILRHAFAGQLVHQDPDDEPASELLNRIAAERAAAATPKKKAAKAR